MLSWRCYLLSFVGLLLPCLGLAQVHEGCPEGLKYVGTIKGTGSFVELLDKRLELKLPQNATLDTSYQQAKVVAAGGKGAHSKLRPEDIPKGIHIVPYGNDESGKAWAVSDPKLKMVSSSDGK